MLDVSVIPPIRLANLPASDSMQILAIPDLHLPASPNHFQLLLRNRDFLDQHDWVMLLGDVTAFYGTPGEYGHVNRFIQAMDRPYSVVNGNHEFSFLAADDGSPEYGHRFVSGPGEMQRDLLGRFEHFYGLSSRYEAGRANGVNFCMLGIDRIGPNDEGLLSAEHEQWFGNMLDQQQDGPLIVFCHFPLCDGRLDSIRYYQAGRTPYLLPSAAIRHQLAARRSPTFWISGHLHFAPSHPLSQPYLTDDGVVQIHCPDARGWGRPNNDKWSPENHDELFIRSLLLEGEHGQMQKLTVRTNDLRRGVTVSEHAFELCKRRNGVGRSAVAKGAATNSAMADGAGAHGAVGNGVANGPVSVKTNVSSGRNMPTKLASPTVG